MGYLLIKTYFLLICAEVRKPVGDLGERLGHTYNQLRMASRR
jgi:hypothetical protein